MRRALTWLNLYGFEAVQLKLKNRQNVHFLCFLLWGIINSCDELFFEPFFLVIYTMCIVAGSQTPSLTKISYNLCNGRGGAGPSETKSQRFGN
jgi:hypothetical protein